MENQIYSVERFSNRKLKVIVDIAIDRELTKEENFLISDKLNEIVELITSTSLSLDQNYIISLKEERDNLIGCFNTPIYVKPILNEYNSKALNPWFSVTTSKGPIIVGWRKRVIVLDWRDSDIEISAEDLFPDEEVTKNNYSIHAYGYDKLREYITKLLNYE